MIEKAIVFSFIVLGEAGKKESRDKRRYPIRKERIRKSVGKWAISLLYTLVGG